MLRRQAGLLLLALAFPLVVAACGPKAITTTPDDATITARVKTVLLNDPRVQATKIDVSTTNGVVTMSGMVRTRAEEARAIELVRGVNGVRDVRSALQVQGG